MTEKNIDKILYEINKETSILFWVKPLNLKEEKEKFFNKKNYNPKFKYKQSNINFDKRIDDLQSLKFGKSPINVLFKRKKDELLKRIELIKSIGTDRFTEKSIKLYGYPKKNLKKLAIKDIGDFKKKNNNRKISYKEAKRKMHTVLNGYGVSNYSIRKGEVMADCACGKRKLYIRPNVKFSRERLQKTIAHEIETHVLRNENGINQPYKIFSYGTEDYKFTEEGLAVTNETLVSKRKDEKKYWPAAYFLAIDVALKKSFEEVYEFLRDFGFTKTRSWVIAVKVKRGVGDTSFPGGFTKDHLYFSGKHVVKKYINKGGNLKDLYIGKIGVNDIEIIKKLKEIKKPKYLPNYIN